MNYVVRRYSAGDAFSYAVFDENLLIAYEVEHLDVIPLSIGVEPVVSGLTKAQADKKAKALSD